MRAMVLNSICSLDTVRDPLKLEDLPRPVPNPGEVLIEVAVCGVCHTELDEIEGRTAPPVLPVIPGHEVIGRIAELGPDCSLHAPGERVGVGWIHSSSGSADENLSDSFTATGRDVNGGYAEFMTVPEAYAYPVPEVFSDEEAAPLLCAGAVGYRALKLTRLQDGQVLALTGFGGSGHLVLQLARHLYPGSPVFVPGVLFSNTAPTVIAAWPSLASPRAKIASSPRVTRRGERLPAIQLRIAGSSTRSGSGTARLAAPSMPAPRRSGSPTRSVSRCPPRSRSCPARSTASRPCWAGCTTGRARRTV